MLLNVAQEFSCEGLHFGLGLEHVNNTLCCCLQGVRAQNSLTPGSAWQLTYIQNSILWATFEAWIPTANLHHPSVLHGVFTQNQSGSLQLFLQSQGPLLLCTQQNWLLKLSWSNKKIFLCKYLTRSEIPFVWTQHSWSHPQVLPAFQFKPFPRHYLVAFRKRTWCPKQPPPEAVGSHNGNKCIHKQLKGSKLYKHLKSSAIFWFSFYQTENLVIENLLRTSHYC